MSDAGAARGPSTTPPAGWPVGRPLAYALAAAGVAAALLLRLAVEGWVEPVFVFFYPVVVVTALRGGSGPALFATLLSMAVSAAWLLPYGGGRSPLKLGDWTGLGTFLAVNALVVAATHRYRAALRRVEALEREAALREARTRVEVAEAGQRESAAAAHLTRAQLEAVLQAMSDGVIVLDADGRAVLVNQALARLTGHADRAAFLAGYPDFSRQFELATLDGEAVGPDAWPLVRALRGESVAARDYRARHLDGGRELLVTFACEPVRDEAGRQVLTVGVVRDIATRIAGEEVLARQRALQERLAALALTVPGAVFTLRLRPDGRMEVPFASPAVREVCGHGPAELLDDATPVRGRVHPDDLAVLLGRAAESARTLAPVRGEFRYLHPTKGPRWLELRAMPRAEPGDATLYDGFVTDVTERREAQEAVRALAARLQAAREEEATRIARDLHDDLGQTLTALQLELRWIEERVERLAPTVEAGPLVDRVVAAAELAAATLTTVQRLSQELHPAALDHLGLAAAIRQELRRFEQRADLAVTATLEADLPPGDPAGKALYRIFLEAITNVARHAQALHVEVRLWRAPDGMGLSVTDDGRGMPPDLVATPATLGLLGMQERAHALGGEVRFLPGARGGTVVTARIPLQPPVAGPDSPVGSGGGPPRRG